MYKVKRFNTITPEAIDSLRQRMNQQTDPKIKEGLARKIQQLEQKMAAQGSKPAPTSSNLLDKGRNLWSKSGKLGKAGIVTAGLATIGAGAYGVNKMMTPSQKAASDTSDKVRRSIEGTAMLGGSAMAGYATRAGLKNADKSKKSLKIARDSRALRDESLKIGRKDLALISKEVEKEAIKKSKLLRDAAKKNKKVAIGSGLVAAGGLASSIHRISKRDKK